MTVLNETVKFPIGSRVYHTVDDDPGLVVGVLFRDSDVWYEVVWMCRVREFHQGIELSLDKAFVGSGSEKKDDDV